MGVGGAEQAWKWVSGVCGAQAAAGEQFPLYTASILTIISLMQQSLFHFY